MPYEEFQGWMKYFKVRPFGWREDQRTSMLLQAQGVKTKSTELFPSLAEMYSQSRKGTIDHNLINALKKAVGGDEWNPIIEE